MDIQTQVKSIVESDADAILVFVFEGDGEFEGTARVINAALDGIIVEFMDGGDFTGKVEQTTVFHPRGAIPAKRVILVGLGKVEQFTVDKLRRAAAAAVQKARDLKGRRVATTLARANPGGLSSVESVQAVVEGGLLGLYSYHGQKTSEAPEDLPKTLEILIGHEDERGEIETGIARGRAFASGTRLARDLVNLPPNICTPSYLGQRAQEMAHTAGLRCEVLEERQIRVLKMGALLAVAQGSDTPPRFIILEHNANRAKEFKTIVLVGKGVTFDTGGYSLKTRDGMIGMKADMGGGAAVFGAMRTIAALDVPLHVVGLVPAADNMISGHAYRPQEVVTASNGKTIEIISTDAEGRMLLADALVYAKRYNPAAVVDIATLTGACVTALGRAAAGLFCTDDKLRDALVRAGEATSERVWPLPLFPEYDKAIESQTADIKNTGGANTGVGTSAAFLRHFVDYPAWAHIDMAGMMLDAEGNPYIPIKGGTGYGSRLLAQFVMQEV